MIQPQQQPPISKGQIIGQSIFNEANINIALFKTKQFCIDQGFSSISVGKITTATSELLRNILKYAGHGQFQLARIEIDGKTGIEITVSDKGPGIADLNAAMQDNYSTTGTLGLGLPGVERLMDYFCIISKVNQGTKVTVRKFL